LEIICILFLTGLFAGTVDSIVGGGGLISLPMLLSIGVPPHIALGTNKLQALVGSSVAAHSYYRKGWLSREGLLRGLCFSFVGAVLGAFAIQVLSSEILKKIIPLVLFAVLIYTLFSPKLGHQDTKPKMNQTTFYLIFATLLGFYDGFLGPGTGVFWVFVLVFFMGFNLLKATAYTKIYNLNTNITAMVCFAVGHNIDYRIGLYMAAGQIIGGKLGAALAIKNGAKLIRPLFLIVVSATILTLLYRNYAGTIVLSKKWIAPIVLAIAGIIFVMLSRRIIAEKKA
jgi:uncharacterized membrane protein YfcA